MAWEAVRNHLRQAFWLVPAGCVAGAGATAVVLVRVDESLQREGLVVAFTGGPESARSLLEAISSSMLTLTALVFSITVVVLQLTSSQFSPRVLRTFVRDRQTQITLGVFLATYVFALLALRQVRGSEGLEERFVPGLTVTASFVLVLVSIGLFVAYIHHITNSIRIVTIINRIREETEEAVERVAPPDAAPPPLPLAAPPGGGTAVAARPGVVVSVDIDRLVAAAADADAVIRVVPRVGDYVPVGAPLLVSSGPGRVDLDGLRDAVQLAAERDTHQDVAFGVRQLVDITERALSPSLNDPTTAVQCLDQVHSILRILGARTLPTGASADERGVVRVVVPVTSWDEYVSLACDEPRHWGASSLQLHRRLRAMLTDLLDVVGPERQPPLRRQLSLLEARTADLPAVEQAAAREPVRRGASDARGT